MEIVEEVQEQEPKVKRRLSLKGAFTRRRKILILAGMFVLLVVTGFLNFSLNNQTPEVGGGQANQIHAFDMFRQNRASERSTQIAILENIVMSTTGYSEAARTQAEQQKLALIEARNFENSAESLIKTQMSFLTDAIVQVNGPNKNVLVRNRENITPQQATQIHLILESVAGRYLAIDNVFISILD